MDQKQKSRRKKSVEPTEDPAEVSRQLQRQKMNQFLNDARSQASKVLESRFGKDSNLRRTEYSSVNPSALTKDGTSAFDSRLGMSVSAQQHY